MPNVPNNKLRNPPFCPFPSFSIVSQSPFINKPDYSSDLTIFTISFISWFEIINVIVGKVKSEEREGNIHGRPDRNIFLWKAASVDDASAVNPNDIKMLLANALKTLFIKGNPVFSNDPKSLPKNPDCPILCNWVFDSFILADELFAKIFWNLKTCVLVNKNLCGKLFSSLESPTTFDEIFRVTSVPYFIADFHLIY